MIVLDASDFAFCGRMLREPRRTPSSKEPRAAARCRHLVTAGCPPPGLVGIRVEAPRRQVEPLPFSLLKRCQANPGQYRRVVAVQVEHHVGRRTVEEVKATHRPDPRQAEATNPVSGPPRQARVPVVHGEANRRQGNYFRCGWGRRLRIDHRSIAARGVGSWAAAKRRVSRLVAWQRSILVGSNGLGARPVRRHSLGPTGQRVSTRVPNG
jgi:hypothetical protein